MRSKISSKLIFASWVWYYFAIYFEIVYGECFSILKKPNKIVRKMSWILCWMWYGMTYEHEIYLVHGGGCPPGSGHPFSFYSKWTTLDACYDRGAPTIVFSEVPQFGSWRHLSQKLIWGENMTKNRCRMQNPMAVGTQPRIRQKNGLLPRHPTVGVAVVWLRQTLPGRLSSSSCEELPVLVKQFHECCVTWYGCIGLHKRGIEAWSGCANECLRSHFSGVRCWDVHVRSSGTFCRNLTVGWLFRRFWV